MVLDPDRYMDSGTDLVRNEALQAWVATIEMPGGMDTARTAAMLWASVADRSVSVDFIAGIVRLPITRAQKVCDLMCEGGGMAFGTGSDGVTYYKLSQAGLNAGRSISEQWLSITRMYP